MSESTELPRRRVPAHEALRAIRESVRESVHAAFPPVEDEPDEAPSVMVEGEPIELPGGGLLYQVDSEQVAARPITLLVTEVPGLVFVASACSPRGLQVREIDYREALAEHQREKVELRMATGERLGGKDGPSAMV